MLRFNTGIRVGFRDIGLRYGFRKGVGTQDRHRSQKPGYGLRLSFKTGIGVLGPGIGVGFRNRGQGRDFGRGRDSTLASRPGFGISG